MAAPDLRIERFQREIGLIERLKAGLAHSYPLEAEDLWRRAMEFYADSFQGRPHSAELEPQRMETAVKAALSELFGESPPLPPLLGGGRSVRPPALLLRRE